MNKAELLEIIQNGESSGVEFKRDDILIQDLAREIVAFANYQGGMILLGVEDDGRISGIRRPNIEEWVMEACRTKVIPGMLKHNGTEPDFIEEEYSFTVCLWREKDNKQRRQKG